ncbi:MAG: CdaR family protein [Candidatus Sericytochromatia bacterium]|jgi:YbbR domain-containing protein|nr:CdaR family protein [Candidatus Sericytochromatia bacterium]
MLIAVLMAIILWMFVRTGAQAVSQRTVYAAIEVVNSAPELRVSPARVEVRVEGPHRLLDQVALSEFNVTADLTGHREGDLVPLSVVPPQGLKLLGTSVNQVRVVRKNDPAP